MDCLARHSWPGNIRQLEQLIRTLLALRQPDEPIGVADLPAEVGGVTVAALMEPPVMQRACARTLEAVQIDAIQQSLFQHRGNVSAAARALGISRATLYKKLRSASA